MAHGMPTLSKGIYSIFYYKQISQRIKIPSLEENKMVICIILQLKLWLFRMLQMKIERKQNKTASLFPLSVLSLASETTIIKSILE